MKVPSIESDDDNGLGWIPRYLGVMDFNSCPNKSLFGV
jgi:hypothetical protein